MKSDYLKHIAEMTGMIAIVASLIFVGFQIKQDRNIAESELLVAEQALDLDFAQLVQAMPETWRKGLAGESLNAEEEVAFDFMAYTLLRLQANSARSRLVLEGTTLGTEGTSERAYAFFIYENPGLLAWFNRLIDGRSHIDRAYGLSDELRFYPAIIKPNIDQLEESQPEYTEKRFYPY